MKFQQQQRNDAWRLSAQKRLSIAAIGVFLGAAGSVAAAPIPVPDDSRYVGAAAENEPVQFSLSLPWRNQNELNDLVERLYTPGDKLYHQFLSSAEFDSRFAPTQAQYDALKSLAQQYGFAVRSESSSHTLLGLSGSAAAVRNVFGAQLHVLETLDGKRYLAPEHEADTPFPIRALGAEVAALNSHPLTNHLVRLGSPVKVSPEGIVVGSHNGSGSQGGYTPADLKNAYNANGIQNGGEPVAVFELSSATYADSATYASMYGLRNTTLVQKKVDGGTTSTTGAGEVMLDIELIMAIAQPATIYVYTGPNSSAGVLDTYTQIANDHLVNEVSTSWGLAESKEGSSNANAENTAFTKMVAEGMALFAAAGDCGAYDAGNAQLGVDDPGSNPNVTSVGGTTLTTTSTQQYTSEVPWATPTDKRRCRKGAGGGGGISTLWAIPSYQQGIVSNAPSGQFSTTMRNVPDVSLDADPNTGYIIYDSVDGGWLQIGGTSAAAPLWAGFWSLASHGAGKAAGAANPTLYALGKNGTTFARDFHDVTSGTNLFYNAVAGYDDASGWGSYNAGGLYADVLAKVGGGSSSGGSGSSSSSGGSSSGASSSSSSSGGSSSSSSGAGSAPVAPTNFSVTGDKSAGKGAEDLAWTASPGATRYAVYMGTTPNGESTTPLGTVTGTSVQVTGLNQLTRYYFKLKAVNAQGASPYSAEASAITR